MSELTQKAQQLLLQVTELHQKILDRTKLLPEGIGKNDGFTKYINKIKSEQMFLKRIIKTPEIKLAHIQCSNYNYLQAIYDLLLNENCLHIYKAFHINGEVVRIDGVCDDGYRWIKVRAGNIAAAMIDYESDETSDSFSELSDAPSLTLPAPAIIRQAKLIVNAAKDNLFHFKPPQITYKFLAAAQIPESILNELISLGIEIEQGQVSRPLLPSYHYLTPILNLDTPTLIALVSDLSHRVMQIPIVAFDSQPLRIQRDMELQTPILPILQKVCMNRRLVCTQAAFEKFKLIIEKIGGNAEKSRAAYMFSGPHTSIQHEDRVLELLDPQPSLDCLKNDFKVPWIVSVIPDCPSDFIRRLDTNKVSDFNINVFGTGDNLKLSTITSNGAAQRSLENAGLNTFIMLHQPRGLIEDKWYRYKIGTLPKLNK